VSNRFVYQSYLTEGSRQSENKTAAFIVIICNLQHVPLKYVSVLKKGKK